nr:NAD-dependent epimerase/dehydratase family protein [uncultured Ruminococcus sp.]
MDYKVIDHVKKSIYTNLEDIANAPISWDKLRGKTLLLTGAGGFIGYYMTCGLLLRNDLYGDNIKVLALERFGDFARAKFGKLLDRDDVTLIEQDITVPIEAERADFVIHAASQASNIEFERDPVGTISANLSGTQNALDFAKESGSEASLIVSSLKVYGTLYTGKPYIEEDDNGYVDFTSYKNCYAIGKRAAETLAASYSKQYGMNIRIVRPSYIFGASRLDDDRVWAQFIANIVRGQDILLKSNGATNRSFCYVTDTVTAMLHVLLDGENCVPYNISNEKSNTTIRGFAQAACEVFPERNMKLAFANPEDEIMPEPSPLDPTPEIMDNKRIRSIGWEPKIDLKEGIRRAVAILEEE